jgi:type I restriction enzyme S subunit
VDRALTDLLSFIVDNRGRTCPVADDGFPLIATNCIKPGQREAVFENVRYVDKETYANWFRAHPLPGDVIFVCKGSPGRVAVVPDPVPYCIAQDMVALRANANVVDPAYLYYRLRAPDVQTKIQKMHVGTLIPHFKKGDFSRLRFSIHESVDEQRRIAGVLGTFDDLITTNRILCGCLQQVAASFYAAAIESGFDAVPLANCVRFHNSERIPLSKAERSAMPGPYPYYGATGVVDSVGEYLFDDVHILVAEDGSVIHDDGSPVVQMVWGKYWVNNHAHVLSGVGISNGLLRQALTANSVAPLVTGAVQAKLSMGRLKALRLRLPLNTQASDQIDELVAAERALSDEVSNLIRTRDELLPLLMSTRVRVEEAVA